MEDMIIGDTCLGCGSCEDECKKIVDAISYDDTDEIYKIDPRKCISCGECVDICPVDAISGDTMSPLNMDPLLTNMISWQGTPYQLGGSSSSGIDCSHFVHEVYKSNGFNYNYRTTHTFDSSPSFTQVYSPSSGDVMLFDGHMCIYDSSPPIQGYTCYGATVSKGVRYGNPSWFHGTPKYYRYKKK